MVGLVDNKDVRAFNEVFKEKDIGTSKMEKDATFKLCCSVDFFDEASKDDGQNCGDGVILKLVNESIYKFSIGCGIDTKKNGELLELWCLLSFSYEKILLICMFMVIQKLLLITCFPKFTYKTVFLSLYVKHNIVNKAKI